MISFKPISYADEVRAGKFRKPGFFKKLVNTAPGFSDGERLRPGYGEYQPSIDRNATGDYINEILQVAKIQSPEQCDVHLWFDKTANKVYMNPQWIAGVKTETDLEVGTTFNDDVENPICVNVENSVIRFSGGQSSASGNKGRIIFPLLARTQFPSSTSPIVTNGTYVTSRRLSGLGSGIITISTTAESDTTKALDEGYTYFLRVALVYDGYQIGELNTQTIYFAPTGGYTLQYVVHLPPTINRRVTHVAVYMSKCPGSVTSPTEPFSYLHSVSLIDSDITWTYNGVTVTYDSETFTLSKLTTVGNTYTVDTGILEKPTDTMYSYSGEGIIAGRHYLYNVYVSSESSADKENIFTNPIGGNAEINAGLPQPDTFSNEGGFYRIRVEPTIGTKIQAIIPIENSRVLILKDRGVIVSDVVTVDNVVALNTAIRLSASAGCSTFNGWTYGDENWIYFAGYDDVYRYRENQYQPLIERPDAQDWLWEYRNVLTSANKEACTIWYVPWGAVYLDFGVLAYTLYPNHGWRQVDWGLGVHFKYPTLLTDGTVLLTKYLGTTILGIYRIQDEDGIPFELDGITPIIVSHDTGYLVLSGSESQDFKFHKFVINRVSETTLGDLKVDIYSDGALIRSNPIYWKWKPRINVFGKVEDKRRGYKWRAVINSDTTTPEYLASAGTMQYDSYEFHGESVTRIRRADDYAISDSQIPVEWGDEEVNIHDIGKVNGARQVILMKDPPTSEFLFDTAMADDTYKIVMESAHPYPGEVLDPNVNNLVTITSKTATGFTAIADDDNILFSYAVIP